MESHPMCPFVSGFSHWASCFQVLSTYHVSMLHSISRQNNILLCWWLTLGLSTHLLMDTWVVSTFQLWIILQWTLIHKYLFEYLFSIPLDIFCWPKTIKQQNGFIWEQQNCNPGLVIYGEPQASLEDKREQDSSIEEKGELGGAVINRVHWRKRGRGGGGFRVPWFFLGWVLMVSHWLGCCQARRNSSSPFWVVK